MLARAAFASGGRAGGAGLGVRPGTGLLYAVGGARRVFVVDAGGKDLGGGPRTPRCVQVIGTRHDAGTLRTPPVLVGPEGDAPADRSMVLAQTEGRLRAFSLPPIATPPEDGSVPAEIPATAAADLPLDGWVWFPPACDGEWLALVTDRGAFRVYGINQPGNFDKAVFPLQSPALPAPPAGIAVRGLAFAAEESAYWVLANGSVQKFRVANIPGREHEVVEAGTATAIGEPTQPPQLNNRRDAASLVVRSRNSAGCKAVLMNLATGEIRWQRQLGVIPAASPIPQEGVVVLASEDGGLVALPGTGATAPGQVTVARRLGHRLPRALHRVTASRSRPTEDRVHGHARGGDGGRQAGREVHDPPRRGRACGSREPWCRPARSRATRWFWANRS